MADSNGHSDVSDQTWINEQFFESIFEKKLNINRADFNIKIKLIKPAVGNGEHYIAEVTRVHVELLKKNDPDAEAKLYSFIVKSSTGDNPDLEEWGILDKELLYYSEIIPKLRELEPISKFVPTCYFTSHELHKSIVVEDLSPYGYKMLNRLEGLDLEHCKLFYTKLGAYHALTASSYEKHGKFGERFHKSNYRKDLLSLHMGYLNTMFPYFLEMIKKYDNLKPFYTKVKDWNQKIFPAMQDATEIKADDVFNVLCHGDSWTNNLLFLNDENKNPTDVCFLDHQLAMFGTPILDIFYFFVTSPTNEVRNKNFDELVRIYYDSLVGNLKKYNYPKPILTLRELHLEILKKGSGIGCFLIIGMLALILVASNETGPIPVVLSDTETGEKIRHNLYNNSRYVNAVESVLKFLENRGLLLE